MGIVLGLVSCFDVIFAIANSKNLVRDLVTKFTGLKIKLEALFIYSH